MRRHELTQYPLMVNFPTSYTADFPLQIIAQPILARRSDTISLNVYYVASTLFVDVSHLVELTFQVS